MTWDMVELGQLFRKTKSVNPMQFADTVFAHHSIPAYDAGAPVFEAGNQIKSNKTILKDNDVLLSKIVPHIRRAWAVTEAVDSYQSIGSSEWMVFNDDRFLPEFLVHLFKSDVFHARLMATTAGVGGSLTRARPKAVGLIKIPLPPLEEQQRIAAILGEAQAAIKQGEESLSLQKAARRTTVERFLKKTEISAHHNLTDVAEVSSGITKGRKVRPDAHLTEVPYMAVSNVKDGYLDLQKVSTIAVTKSEVDRFQLKHGDLLLTEGGDPDKLGRGTVWQNEIPGAIHQNHIFRCRLVPSTSYTPLVLMAVIASQASRQYFLQSAKQTTGIATINKTQLSNLKIPALKQAKVDELHQILLTIDKRYAYSEKKLTLLQELYASLSARAFAGDL